MILQDIPIETPQQDKFGRARFAEALAQNIIACDAKAQEVVVGLNGKWGDGKSSVVELIKYYVEKCEVLPQLNSEQNSVTDHEYDNIYANFLAVKPFLDELVQTGKDPFMTNRAYIVSEFVKILKSKEISNLVYDFARIRELCHQRPAVLVVSFSPWLISGKGHLAGALLSELQLKIGNRLGRPVHEALKEYAGRFAEVVALTSETSDLITGTGLGKKIGAFVRSCFQIHGSKKVSLETRYLTLKSRLQNLNDQKILFILDDLDRLLPHEALEISNLIKGVMSLPNVIFLLSYDHAELSRLISNALSDHSADSRIGTDYLSKIVQVRKSMPVPSGVQMERYFSNVLSQMLENYPDVVLEEDELGLMWTFSLRFYLKNPRDVLLFMNGFDSALEGQRRYTDPLDLLLLTAIRIFDPTIYDYVTTHLDEFRGQYER